jgi:hypothetical protein
MRCTVIEVRLVSNHGVVNATREAMTIGREVD